MIGDYVAHGFLCFSPLGVRYAEIARAEVAQAGGIREPTQPTVLAFDRWRQRTSYLIGSSRDRLSTYVYMGTCAIVCTSSSYRSTSLGQFSGRSASRAAS